MLLIYTATTTPRVLYTMDLVFTNLLGTAWELTNNKEAFLTCEGPKLNYSNKKFSNEFFIDAHSLLFENDIKPIDVDVQIYNQTPVFFITNPVSSSFPFDLFAASFYLVTRYEEYLPFKGDQFGRYTSDSSLAARHNFVKRPVVNLWSKLLKEKLKEIYPGLSFANSSYQFKATIDVDNAYAYLDKGWIRTIGAIGRSLKNLQFKEVPERLTVIKTRENDPYDTYQYLWKLEDKYQIKHLFFFLLGDYAKYDRNVHFRNKNFTKLIKEIGHEHEVGIHPSFNSNYNPFLVKKEIERLNGILQKETTKSRQHFLMLKFPFTYQNLVTHGIEEDYSMGYSDIIGFRAGITSPFKFFNLLENMSTNLLIHPFSVMEATLKNYMHLSPIQALDQIKEVVGEVKKINGTFTTLWHNETLCNKWDWTGWKDLYEETIKMALP